MSVYHNTDNTTILYDNDYADNYSRANSFYVENKCCIVFIIIMNNNVFKLPNVIKVLYDISFTFDLFDNSANIDTERDNIINKKASYNDVDDKDENAGLFHSDQLFAFSTGRDVLDD